MGGSIKTIDSSRGTLEVESGTREEKPMCCSYHHHFPRKIHDPPVVPNGKSAHLQCAQQIDDGISVRTAHHGRHETAVYSVMARRTRTIYDIM